MTAPISLTPPVGPGGATLVVLGPSLGTSTILWEDVVPALAREWRVVAWDLPGHGDAPSTTEPFTVGDLADAVARSIHQLGGGPVLYAGVSLGGATGLELCLRHPQLVSGAAIIASGAKLGDAASWHERAAQVRAQSTSSLVTASAGRWFAPDSIARRPDLSGRLLHALREADDESYALCCEALAQYDVRERLGEVTTPVLAAWGEFDAVAPREKAVEIAEGVTEGFTEKIPGAAHLPPAEQPVAIIDSLLAYFSDIDRRRHDDSTSG
ncbi:MAG TPA: alpha/beta fold hydrolase [Microbacterium sp.]|uniref:alpha/beta fold hydrolase n=1 Tax=Microbacterium sp. TaxID=51671 RepID=UPI002C0309AD|nr:alpha/beta fold hydrolase [Microbacterium sp.]HWI31918.1 alpha/beta fold hydrolase [Microbacterium sp.]